MKVTEIHASVKITPKIGQTFYSFEYGETRQVFADDDIETARQELFDTCYNEVAKQIQEVQQNH